MLLLLQSLVIQLGYTAAGRHKVGVSAAALRTELLVLAEGGGDRGLEGLGAARLHLG